MAKSAEPHEILIHREARLGTSRAEKTKVIIYLDIFYNFEEALPKQMAHTPQSNV